MNIWKDLLQICSGASREYVCKGMKWTGDCFMMSVSWLLIKLMDYCLITGKLLCTILRGVIIIFKNILVYINIFKSNLVLKSFSQKFNLNQVVGIVDLLLSQQIVNKIFFSILISNLWKVSILLIILKK